MVCVSQRRKASGQSIVETVVGIIFLIPIALFLLDIAVLVLSNTANDHLAISAARAAASGKDLSSGLGSATAGFTSAQIVSDRFASSAIINKPANSSFLTGYCWNGYGTPDVQGTVWPGNVPKPSAGSVGVITTMTVTLPVPFPLVPNSFDFQAMAVEPIVSIASGPDPGATLATNSDGSLAGGDKSAAGAAGSQNQGSQADASSAPGSAALSAINGFQPAASPFSGGPTATQSNSNSSVGSTSSTSSGSDSPATAAANTGGSNQGGGGNDTGSQPPPSEDFGGGGGGAAVLP